MVKVEDPKLDKNLVADRSQRYKHAARSDQQRKARSRARCRLEVSRIKLHSILQIQ